MAASPPRAPACDDPLALPSSRESFSQRGISAGEITGSSTKTNLVDRWKGDINDPLGLHMSDEILCSDIPHVSTSYDKHDEAVQLPDKEWAVFKRALKQKFNCNSMVHVHVVSDLISRSYKEYERPSTGMHLEELDDPEKSLEDESKFASQQEYISCVKELKVQIDHAWRNEDRVASLKLAIKVARLLMDTSVLHFYPMLFALVTDVMDMLGDFVWTRIKKKAEYTESGTSICTLRDDFLSSDVGSEAKETCYNWFCKIGSIHIWSFLFSVVGVSCKIALHITLHG